YENFDWVESLEHHSLLYAAGGLGHALAFLLSPSGPTVSFAKFAGRRWWEAPTDPSGMRNFAIRAEENGWTILWTEVTAPEVAQFGHVVKVIVPEMMPLSQSHRARWLATPRLLSAAGLTTGSSAAFNPFPHPFA